jgi:transposase
VSKLAGHQTARAVIEAMIAGERDPQALAALGRGRMRNDRLPALAESLTGMRSGPEHAHAAASLLSAIDLLEEELRVTEDAVTAQLASIPAAWGVDADGVTGPEAGRDEGAAVLPAVDRLDEIPGLGRGSAAALIAEIGLDMSRFPAPEALVSRAGLTPTARQSGPRKGRGKKGRGNTYAKRICVLAACAAANTDTFLGERFRRIASRPGGGGRKKAGCAVGRSVLGQVAGARCRAPAPSEPDLPVIPASGSSKPLRALRVAAVLCPCAAGPCGRGGRRRVPGLWRASRSARRPARGFLARRVRAGCPGA